MTLDLFITGYGRPDLLRQQRRLFAKWLFDRHTLTVVDNTPDSNDALNMEKTCKDIGVRYWKSPSQNHTHPEALNFISATATTMAGCTHWMTIDHDLFPQRGTRLIHKIDKAGFYGVGQWHNPSSTRYLWPGFCGFSNEWLAGRVPNFEGIRGGRKADDGDCGSMLGSLFTQEDWEKIHRTDHGYRVIRPEDHYGLQSYGIEFFDDFIHLTNASHWMDVPDSEGRDVILMDLVSEL